jgi:uncharacterized protein YjbI with pentapeptide repeats
MKTSGPGEKADRSALASARYGATVRRLDLSQAALSSVSGPKSLRLDRCTFAGADLRLATLDGWFFKLCDLTGVNLRGASLRGASFAGCDLTGADLRDTDLTYVEFRSVGVGDGAIETRLDRVLCDPGVELSLS